MASSPTMATPCLILRLMETKWAFRATSPTTDTNQRLAKTLRRPTITNAQRLLTLPPRTTDRPIRRLSIRCRRHPQRILRKIRANHITQSTARPLPAKPGSQHRSKLVAQSIATRKAWSRARRASTSRCRQPIRRAASPSQLTSTTSLCSSC